MTNEMATTDQDFERWPCEACEVPLILRDHRLTPLRPDDDFWVSLKTDQRFADGSLVSIFDYQRTWTKRERHPDGDELVLSLHGAATVVLQTGDDETRRVPLRQGEWFVIPRMEWHWLEASRPTRLLFITPHPARTEEQPLPKASGAASSRSIG